MAMRTADNRVAGGYAELASRDGTRVKRNVLAYAGKYAVLLPVLALLLFPYVFMISKSFMSVVDVNRAVVRFWPTSFHPENYRVFIDYIRYFFNSFIIVAINGIFVPLTGCMVAFPLARNQFFGKKFWFALIMATYMIPSSVIQVPLYTLYVKFGLYDTLASQYIGAFLGGSAIQIFLIMQFMRAIPKDFDSAARIDGANSFRIFTRIIMPMCFNVCVYISIGIIIGKWNDFQGPLIYIASDNKFPVAVAFYYHFSSSTSAGILSNVKMAMAVCMTVFPALLFFVFQKQMIGGIKIGGIKG